MFCCKHMINSYNTVLICNIKVFFKCQNIDFYKTILLSYILQIIKSFILSVQFSNFIEIKVLQSHHQNPISEPFYEPEKFPCAHFQTLIIPTFLLRNPLIYILSLNICPLDHLYTWNNALCSIASDFFSQLNVSEVYPRCSMYHQFVFFIVEQYSIIWIYLCLTLINWHTLELFLRFGHNE